MNLFIMAKKTKKTKENVSKLPSKDGNYNLFNTKEEIVYTGQGDIKDRISNHKNNPKIPFTSYTYTLEPSAKKREQKEENRIKRYKPRYNKQKK